MPLHKLYLYHGIKGGEEVTPRTGRPPKGESSKNISLQLRITEKTANQLKECAEILGISRTEVIEKGIEKIYAEVVNKK